MRTYPHGVPCWIDTEQLEPVAAARFYGELFGWTLEDATPAEAPGSYSSRRATARTSRRSRRERRAGRVEHVRGVDDADTTAAAVTSAGGSVTQGPVDADRAAGWRPAPTPPARASGSGRPGHGRVRRSSTLPGPGTSATCGPRTRPRAGVLRPALRLGDHRPGFGSMIRRPGYGDHLERPSTLTSAPARPTSPPHPASRTRSAGSCPRSPASPTTGTSRSRSRIATHRSRSRNASAQSCSGPTTPTGRSTPSSATPREPSSRSASSPHPEVERGHRRPDRGGAGAARARGGLRAGG